jgi:hypothetical protein
MGVSIMVVTAARMGGAMRVGLAVLVLVAVISVVMAAAGMSRFMRVRIVVVMASMGVAGYVAGRPTRNDLCMHHGGRMSVSVLVLMLMPTARGAVGVRLFVPMPAAGMAVVVVVVAGACVTLVVGCRVGMTVVVMVVVMATAGVAVVLVAAGRRFVAVAAPVLAQHGSLLGLQRHEAAQRVPSPGGAVGLERLAEGVEQDDRDGLAGLADGERAAGRDGHQQVDGHAAGEQQRPEALDEDRQADADDGCREDPVERGMASTSAAVVSSAMRSRAWDHRKSTKPARPWRRSTTASVRGVSVARR